VPFRPRSRLPPLSTTGVGEHVGAERPEAVLGCKTNGDSTNRAIQDAATSLGATPSTPDQDDRARTALRRLVDAAQSDGDMRQEVTPDDIILIMTSAPTQFPKQARDRWLEICIAGISVC